MRFPALEPVTVWRPRLRMNSRAAVVLIAILALVCAMRSSVARAQTPDPSDRVHAVAKQLNCPTCGGRNLSDCPTDTCTQWKQEIRAQLEAGKSPQQVIEYFNARFGPSVLQEPPKEGAVLVLWVLPVIGLLALGAGAAVVLRRVTAQKTATIAPNLQTASAAAPPNEYEARLEEEVKS